MVFDKYDIEILRMLSKNARKPYLEIARDLGMSGAAVHQRVQRLISNNVILGSECVIAPASVDFHITAYLGISAMPGTDIEQLADNLRQIPYVTECNVVTGRYDILAKLYARNNSQMLDIIQGQIANLSIASTETMVSFRECFHRPIPIEDNI